MDILPASPGLKEPPSGRSHNLLNKHSSNTFHMEVLYISLLVVEFNFYTIHLFLEIVKNYIFIVKFYELFVKVYYFQNYLVSTITPLVSKVLCYAFSNFPT